MPTIEVSIPLSDDGHERLIADLSDLDFDAFLQEDNLLKAFIPANRWSDTNRDEVERLALAYGGGPVSEREVPPENWNRVWEETIKPIIVGAFVIKPTWAELPREAEGKTLLEIDPKMSFGTGYHESTRLALRFLPEVIGRDDRVLDAGTGTGILAVAAIKLGAHAAVAFDNDEWAQTNAVENFILNGVQDQVVFREGTLDVVPECNFDVVVANINRNILMEMLPGFRERLVPGGRLVLAGLLQQDRDAMLKAAAPLRLIREATENEWWSVVLMSEGEEAGSAA